MMVQGPSFTSDTCHMGTELAVLHVLEAVLSHLGKEQLIGIHRERRLCSLIKLGR